MTSTDRTLLQALPACALAGWAAAWVAGHCAPDDVADTLAEFADRHVVEPRTDDIEPAEGVLGVLGLFRDARSITVRLPSPGDPQGMPPHPATAAAVEAGEAIVVDDGSAEPLVVVPVRDGTTCRWQVFHAPVSAPTVGPENAGDIEYELRQAISESAQIIGQLSGVRVAPADLRDRIRARTAELRISLPPHDDIRADRIFDTAAQVEAIVDAARGAMPAVTAGQAVTGDDELRRLTRLARTARSAAMNRTLTRLLA